jgi:hypothetical protein
VTELPNTPSESQRQANQLIDLAGTEQWEKKERAPVRFGLTRQRGVLVSLTIATPILVAVLMMNFAGPFLASLFETKPPAAVAREEAQKTLAALVGEIEAFRKDYNELPETLVEIGVPSRGTWTYVPLGKQYRVKGSLYGQSVSFDSR